MFLFIGVSEVLQKIKIKKKIKKSKTANTKQIES